MSQDDIIDLLEGVESEEEESAVVVRNADEFVLDASGRPGAEGLAHRMTNPTNKKVTKAVYELFRSKTSSYGNELCEEEFLDAAPRFQKAVRHNGNFDDDFQKILLHRELIMFCAVSLFNEAKEKNITIYGEKTDKLVSELARTYQDRPGSHARDCMYKSHRIYY